MKKQERAVLIGLTSRGPTPCGRLQSYGINTRIKMFLGWIKGRTGESFQGMQFDTLSDGAWVINDSIVIYYTLAFTLLSNVLDC